MVIRLWFDPSSGDSMQMSEADSVPSKCWLVIREDEGVSILDDANSLVAAGRWTGKGIANRYAADDPLDDSTWGKLEHALRQTTDTPSSDAGVGTYREAIVQLATGDLIYDAHEPSDRRAANAFEWKIEYAGGDVTVTSSKGASATARWVDGSLADCTPRGLSPNDYQWEIVERAVHTLTTGLPPPPFKPRPSREPRRRLLPRMAASQGAVRTSSDRRSGWWALAAFLVSLVGTILAWKVSPHDGLGLATTIGLGACTLGLGIYALYGVTTRCPECKAWYRRETTSTTNLGTTTTTRYINEPVHDSSGKQTGTVSTLATYEVTRYRYHYRCKECAHQWTGTGSSERRIS